MNWRVAGQSPAILLHLNLVIRISLGIGALAATVLLLMLVLISGEGGASYGELIRIHSLTREHLNAAMLAAGLVLVTISAVLTSLIGYYSSYRVAGPLYRFGQNLQLAARNGQAALVPLRRGDALTEQAAGVNQAVAALRAHHAALQAAAGAAAQALQAGDGAGYAVALERLKECDALAEL